MKPYQEAFIKFALKNGALRFGSFTLKSGRQSPYFFNAGMFIDGEAFSELGVFYAYAIKEQFPVEFDVIFGPAYKGIQIATCASIALQQKYHLTFPVSFNRKEPKDHGEGGLIVGSALKGKRVLLTDDVITAGTAIREAAKIISQEGGTLVGIVIALNRQEVGQKSQESAIQEVEREFDIPVISIINRDDLIQYVSKLPKDTEQEQALAQLEQYKVQYGSKA